MVPEEPPVATVSGGKRLETAAIAEAHAGFDRIIGPND